MNIDGYIDILDLVITINIIIGTENASNNQLIIGDINNDNVIDVLDVVLLINIILE